MTIDLGVISSGYVMKRLGCCHSIGRCKGSTLEISHACAVFLPFASMQLLTRIKACSALRLKVIDFAACNLHHFWIKELPCLS